MLLGGVEQRVLVPFANLLLSSKTMNRLLYDDGEEPSATPKGSSSTVIQTAIIVLNVSYSHGVTSSTPRRLLALTFATAETSYPVDSDMASLVQPFGTNIPSDLNTGIIRKLELETSLHMSVWLQLSIKK